MIHVIVSELTWHLQFKCQSFTIRGDLFNINIDSEKYIQLNEYETVKGLNS